MYICDDNHEEIVHSGRNCPLCEAYETITELEADVEKEQEANNKHLTTIEKLENEIACDIAGTPAE